MAKRNEFDRLKEYINFAAPAIVKDEATLINSNFRGYFLTIDTLSVYLGPDIKTAAQNIARFMPALKYIAELTVNP